MGSIRSQRARMHFCWLPPERVVTGTSPPAVLIASSLTERATARFSARGSTSGPIVSSGSRRSVMFWATVMPSKRPSVLRSSVVMAIPALIAWSGCVNRTGLPSSRIAPVGWYGLAPKIASSNSVRPAPSSPATPSTSPARTEKLIPRKFGRPLPGGLASDRFSTSSTACCPIGCWT